MITILSRYGTKRTMKKISDKLIEYTSYDTLYYTGTGSFENLNALDVEGGPCLYKNSIINIDDENFEIIKFTNINFDYDKELLTAILEVDKK